jgi:Ca2+/H+ antiporter, TMEM165/GDT1 family
VKLSSGPLPSVVLVAPPSSIVPAIKNKDSELVSRSVTPTKPAIDSSVTEQKSQSSAKHKPGFGGIFGSTFLTIFLAEMGDKTQLATLLMSAQSNSPWMVFAGAAAALIATSLLGVLIGRWLANRLSPKTLETSAGALLLFISVMLLWDVVQLGG